MKSPRVGHSNSKKKKEDLKHTDIHWKALEEHFFMVPLDFRFNHFQGRNVFSEFFSVRLLTGLKENSLFGFQI
jgi:hypothetical protein